VLASSRCDIEDVETLEISPLEAAEKLKVEGEAVLIDVREPEEFALSRLDKAQLIPMQSIPSRLQTLEGLADESTLLILCHHGVRSLQVAAWLRAQGIESAYSIAGGIDAWSLEVDPSVPRY
jgi:rhodanese-related sulfurtransferase